MSKTNPDAVCKTCRYSDLLTVTPPGARETVQLLLCRRHPPVPLMVTTGMTPPGPKTPQFPFGQASMPIQNLQPCYPQVGEPDWCGEWADESSDSKLYSDQRAYQ